MQSGEDQNLLNLITSMKEKIEEMEVKLIFQDDLLNSLNDVIVRQDKEILKLWDANRFLKQSMQDIRSGMKDDFVEPPPPHY